MVKIAFDKGYRIVNNQAVSPKGKILKLSLTNGKIIKYYQFGIKVPDLDKTLQKSFSVRYHHLVAYEKYGDEFFKNDVQVRHFNGDSLDNDWNNILLGSRSDNMQDINPLDRKITALKNSWNVRKYKGEILNQIKIDKLNGFSNKEISIKHNISPSSVWYMINKSTYFNHDDLDDVVSHLTATQSSSD